MPGLNSGPVIGTPQVPVAVDFGAALLASTLSAVETSSSSLLPAGFPAQLQSKLAWTGSDFQKWEEGGHDGESSFVYQLDAADLAEIAAAVAHFKALELDGGHVSRDTFPLPRLGAKLDKIGRDVHDGRGFGLVRGLKPEDYPVADLTLAYLGVQAYIADQRGRQDSRGNMLVHIVADNSSKTRTEHHRHSNKTITFHNEETGDVVSWLTRSTASSGGRCIIASAYTIYNVLAAKRPDLLRLLTRSDWPFALPRFQCRPVVFYHDSKLIMNFGRTALLGTAIHPRPSHLPAVTAHQKEALDAVEAIAQATQLAIPTQAGDMHFINNLAILHRREGFTDGTDTAEKRHLVRMRLRNTQWAWALPQPMEEEWAAAFDEKARKMWHVEPMPDAFFPLRKYPN